jgi:hypothetical protein
MLLFTDQRVDFSLGRVIPPTLAIISDGKWNPRKHWRESNGGLFDFLQKSTSRDFPGNAGASCSLLEATAFRASSRRRPESPGE